MQLRALRTIRFCAAAMAAVLCLWAPPAALAQEEGPATSKGENFSAKPPAALFNSDCTGAGCHKGPQGLGKGQSQSGLSGFLREHYTNSRESAAALAGYLLKLPAGPEPREREARPTRPGRGEPASASPGSGEGFFGSRLKQREAKPEPKPESKPAETRTSRPHPAPKSSRAAAKPEDKPDEAADSKETSPKEEAAPKETPKEAAKEKETPVRQASPKPPTRAQRGRATAAAPPPPPEPPPAPAPPPPKKEYDIFD